jgi:hypothetical protein
MRLSSGRSGARSVHPCVIVEKILDIHGLTVYRSHLCGKGFEEYGISCFLKMICTRLVFLYEIICFDSSSSVNVCLLCVFLRFVSWMVWNMLNACLGGTWLR